MAFNVDNYIIVSRLLSRSNGTTIREMASALDVSERQVYNILDQMYFILHYDQYKDPGNPRITRYKSLGDAPKLNLPELELSADEIAVFNQIKEQADLSPALKQTAETLFEKLQLMASERGKKIKVGDDSRRLIINAQSISKSIGSKNTTKAIQTLLDVIKKHQWMNVEYISMKTKAPFLWEKLYPLQLFVSNGDTYLYVFTRNKDLKMLAIERIEKIMPYDGEKIESMIDFRRILSDPFGIMLEEQTPYKVKLWINEFEGTYLKQKEWPDTVKITDNEDGSIIFEAETRTRYDCITWIQARIDRVKILEPEWLKEEVLKNLRTAMELNS